MQKDQIIHLISPGLDSVLSYLYMRYELNLKEEILCYHIPYSQLYSKQEMSHMKDIFNLIKADCNNKDEFIIYNKFLEEHKDFISTIENQENAFCINRNLLLLTVVNSLEPNAKIISLGITKYDRVYDSNQTYLDNISKILYNNPKIKSYITAYNKTELLNWFFNCEKLYHIFDNRFKKVDFIINNTYSCYKGTKEECLSCNACFRKNVSLYNSIKYTRPFYNKEIISQYINSDDYPIKRKDLIQSYINSLELKRKVFNGKKQGSLYAE